jgi:hypothetical protein
MSRKKKKNSIVGTVQPHIKDAQFIKIISIYEGEKIMDSKFKPAYVLSMVIVGLTMVTSVAGLFIPELYRDSEPIKIAWFGNDLVTLAVAIPLLTASLVYSLRGSQQAQLVWLGMLDYTLYNFAFYLFGAALNRLTLVYIGLFALSIFALIFGLANLDVNGIRKRFQAKIPVKLICGYMLFWAALLGVVWIAQLLNFAISGHVAQSALGEGGFKLVAALDLSFVVPGVLLAAIWLWQRRPWGYVLAVVFNVKGAIYTLVLTIGSLYSARAGVQRAADLIPLWIFLGVACLISAVLLLKDMGSKVS